MKKISIRYLVASAGLALFPLMAISAPDANDPGPALRVDESAHALEAQTKVNPFDAIALNNEAVKMSRDGSQLQAAQLLLRAHKLAPDNKIIGRNFQQLNDWMAKRTSSSQTVDTQQAARPVLPDPPAIWGSAADSGSRGRSQGK